MLDIEAIDLPDAAVDGVISRMVLMLVPDIAAALGEIHRVLRPGGRLSAAVWDTVERNPWAPVLWDVIERMTDIPQARPGGPGMFTLADAGRLRSLLAGCRVRRDRTSSRSPSPGATLTSRRTGGRSPSLNGAITQLLPTLPDADRRRIADAVRAGRRALPDGKRLQRSGLGAGHRRHTVII